jgi:DNA-binding HxlR family transcriptional regulator
MGGAPAGIICANSSAASGAKGASSGTILDISPPPSSGNAFLKPKRRGPTVVLRNQKRNTTLPMKGSGEPAAPMPGRPVRGSTTGRPIMAALDLLGRRWTLRILWELRTGPAGARDLARRCDGMSSSVLYQRLGELVHARLVEQDDDERYVLTDLGHSLGESLAPLDRWAKRWAQRS